MREKSINHRRFAHGSPQRFLRGFLRDLPWHRPPETSFEGVYAIGDLTQVMLANKKPLPKAGLFAELMGETVAERIADVFNNQQPTATFSGEAAVIWK